jgi:hypothetical protein
LGALVLACGKAADGGGWPRTGVEWHEIPSAPGRNDVDPLLAGLDGRRVVVFGTDADLAAVVLRLLRTERLGGAPVGFVPADAGSPVARLWRLPPEPARAVEVALCGQVDRVPLIRDDTGGVLVGLGVLAPVRGVAYCDDQVALRGSATRIEVTADAGAGLLARVIRGGLLRRRTEKFRGRAFQVGCDPVVPVRDGIAHPRPVERWTWYRHTEDLRVIRPLMQ